MTILPAKRASPTVEDKPDNTQNGNPERRREHVNANSESVKSSSRRPFKRSATPEPTDHILCKRFKETNKPARRKQARERLSNRVEVPTEETLEPCSSQAADSKVDETQPAKESSDTEDATGFNSEDEYAAPLHNTNSISDEEWTNRDARFARCLSKLGYEIKQMHDDGACLFRAIADQIFGDQELHYMVRTSCMDYIVKNKDFFTNYVTEDFDKYIERKRLWNVHGNHLEIQAMSEMYNRTIEVYCYDTKPMNIFNRTVMTADEPIRLSYHRMCHYNSICNPNNPSVGVGLGLPSYHTIDLNRRRLIDAVRASEELLLEQTMLEDKLKATDWEATNEAMEEEVARESYIQYYRDAEKRLKPQGHAASSSSTVTSAVCSSPRPSTRRGSASPKGGMSPKGGSSPKGSCSLRSVPRSPVPAICHNTDASASILDGGELVFKPSPSSPTNKTPIFNEFDTLFASQCNYPEAPEDAKGNHTATGVKNLDWDEGIMAQVLAESRKTYLDELKRNNKKQGSPGPSTSR